MMMMMMMIVMMMIIVMMMTKTTLAVDAHRQRDNRNRMSGSEISGGET